MKLLQTEDRYAPETFAVRKHKLGHIDVRTGEIIENIADYHFDYVLIDDGQDVKRGSHFLGTYLEYNPIVRKHMRKCPTLSVNVLCSFEQ